MPWPSIARTICQDAARYLETYMKPYLGLVGFSSFVWPSMGCTVPYRAEMLYAAAIRTQLYQPAYGNVLATYFYRL
jgi:hypothetical protein